MFLGMCKFVENEYPFSHIASSSPLPSVHDWYPLDLVLLSQQSHGHETHVLSNTSAFPPLSLQDSSGYTSTTDLPLVPSPNMTSNPPSTTQQVSIWMTTRLQNNIRKPIKKLNLMVQLTSQEIESRTIT